MNFRLGNVYQYIRSGYDSFDFRKGIVIPLPGDRALRLGLGIDFWCTLGPRRYKVVWTQDALDDLAELVGEDKAEDFMKEVGGTLGEDPNQGGEVPRGRL